MSTGARYIIRNGPPTRHNYEVNDIEPEELRVSSLRARPYDEDYPRYEPRYSQKQLTPPAKSRTCCSKPCVLGLLLGLAIGLAVAAAVAIPLGLVKRPTPPFGKYQINIIKTFYHFANCVLVRGDISSTPTWVGTYQVDSSCDSSTCCCFTNYIYLTTTSASLLQLNGTLSGRCVGSSNVVSYAMTMPTNFALGFTWYGQTLRVILSQDSSYLAMVDNTVGYCSGSALRTSYNASRINHVNSGLMMLILFILIGIVI
ncbi:unnamed protein product [Adineta ricciae]|uniref:Uncharacterized protein n=1 Tax=Adineta ricciae TaxID=249248 RepID=A0A815J3C6_ADIRI|nr:unnamed protein product [Adineta ricciae]